MTLTIFLLLAFLAIFLKYCIAPAMVERNLSQNSDPQVSLFPAVQTAAKVVDVWIDVRDFDAAMFVTVTGALAGAFIGTPTAREADDVAGTNAANVAAGDLQGAFIAVVANQTQKVGYRGVKPFIGVALAYVSGTSIAIAGTIERDYPHSAPKPNFTVNP